MCLGEDGMLEQVREIGFQNAFLLPHDNPTMTDTEFANYDVDTEIRAVIKGPH